VCGCIWAYDAFREFFFGNFLGMVYMGLIFVKNFSGIFCVKILGHIKNVLYLCKKIMDMGIEEIYDGCKLLYKHYGKNREDIRIYDDKTKRFEGLDYHESWDLMMPIVDIINSKGKEYSFVIFKNYISLTIEKDSKFFKDFRFAYSEYITQDQTGKEACFKLLVKYTLWEIANKE
jgi:hypothetical protein